MEINLLEPATLCCFGPFTKRRTKEDLPQDILAQMVAKTCVLGALAWDYADTVVKLASVMRIEKTRGLSRAVKALYDEYRWMRHNVIDSGHAEKEKELAELFEEINAKAFSRLCQGLRLEIGRNTGLNEDYTTLVCAVQMAMTVIDTMRLHDAECSRWMESQGVAGLTVIPGQYDRLAILLPEFAGDCYDPKSEARRITSRILYNEISRVEFCSDDGQTDNQKIQS